MKKKALITGITGQDGSYLAELLLEKGYEVHGIVRRVSSGPQHYTNISGILDKITLHKGDLADAPSLFNIVKEVQPDEVYNLAAQADVGDSFKIAEYSVDINGAGVVRMLEAVRQNCPKARFYQASTSELFGDSGVDVQNEKSPMNPQSPYAIGKLAGFRAVQRYRRDYGLFASNGILFNHESERRGEDYLTRKVTKAAARIFLGLQQNLYLGSLDPKRDWGYAKDFAELEWKILQHDKPDDFVIGTGETHTVQEWVDEVFNHLNLDPKKYVVQDKRFVRPAEVYVLCADYSKAKKELGFEPKVKFKELAELMVKHDIEHERRLRRGA